MDSTPKGNRLHIALMGRTNVGKSSLLNFLTGQDIAITSPISGTTTDIVEKAAELLPLGPVLFLDTAGLDDRSALSDVRLKKTAAVYNRADVILLVTDAETWTPYEDKVMATARTKGTPVIIVVNKIDLKEPSAHYIANLKDKSGRLVTVSCKDMSNRDACVESLKRHLLEIAPDDYIRTPALVGDLLPAGGIAVLVIPIDLQAPKGRLILPQVQTIRDALDNDAAVLIVKERELAPLMNCLNKPPDLVVCDSQVILKVTADVPRDFPCTTFSILFARQKGDLAAAAQGAACIENLKRGDRILIAEACSHHPLQDDIGRVKIPRWLRQYTGTEIKTTVVSGRDFPENLKDYNLIIHCGACMLSRREMLNRIQQANDAGIPITNYGLAISYLQGVVRRVLLPFPAALMAYDRRIEDQNICRVKGNRHPKRRRMRDLLKQNTRKPANMNDFIDDAKIDKILSDTANPDSVQVRDIIAKARELQGLTPYEAAVLLQTEDKELIELMRETAKGIKRSIYGNRLVLFAPLYIANYCSNNCLYCGFRRENKELNRVALTMDQIADEVRVLEQEGHKRLLMLCGEHPTSSSLDYFIEAIETAYATKTTSGGEIRRINVEIAPMSVEDFKRLKAAKIGTYVLFQETYHHDTYRKMHPTGPKSDYLHRLTAMDRAQQAGIDDVGIGPLLGLYDFKFEVLGLLFHALHLESEFGTGPHTISIPRLEAALNAPAAIKPPTPVSDDDFKKLVTVIRLAVPYTGMILSTRETPEVRQEVFELGISQISAGSRTNPGGYRHGSDPEFRAAQFNLGDTRTLDEVIHDIALKDHIPSFCTACYRRGRTGKDFMDLAKPGLIQKFCRTNAILTFKEYLEDYASPPTKAIGETLIGKLVDETDKAGIRKTLQGRLKRIEKGDRDLYI